MFKVTTNVENMLKLIGGGTSGWQTRAAEVMDISRGTVRNALKGKVSEKSLKKIRATYAAMCRHAVPQDADRTAGAWVIGMPLRKGTDRSILDECVVTHMQEPCFSVHVILRAGKTAPGPLGERNLDVRTTTIAGDKTGFGTLHETAQEIGLGYMRKAQFDRIEAQYRTDVEARVVAKKWGSAKEAKGAKISELDDAFDVLTDDDVQAAHDMIREM